MEGARYKIHLKSGSAMLIGIVVILSIIFLLFFGGTATGMTLLTIKNRTGELNPSGINFGGLCGGTVAPTTTQTLDSYSIPDGGTGKIVHESHLVTDQEPKKEPEANLPNKPWNNGDGSPVRSSNANIERHLAVTNFSTNCIGSSFCDPDNQEWTPGETIIGNGNRGLGVVPAELEPWVMNARWPSPQPSPGTRVVITNTANNKSIVAIAGYEYGPGNRRWNIGAQAEVMANIAADNNTTVTFGFAVDQTLAPGTVYGADCTGSNIRVVRFAERELLGFRTGDPDYRKGENRVKYNNFNGDFWCAWFVIWLYRQAGFQAPSEPNSQELLKWFENNKHATFTDPKLAQPGDVMVFWKDSVAGHTAMVYQNTGSEIITIEGNTGRGDNDRVKKRIRTYENLNNSLLGDESGGTLKLKGFARW